MGASNGSHPKMPVSAELNQGVAWFKEQFAGTVDFTMRSIRIAGHRGALMMVDNMTDKHNVADSVVKPLSAVSGTFTPEALWNHIKTEVLGSVDQSEVDDYSQAAYRAMSGFLLILLDGVPKILAVGIQSFPTRSVSDPSSETSLRGTKEALCEVLHLNMSMLRRRMKTPDLKFETMQVGTVSQTEVSLCYLKSRVSEEILKEIRRRLQIIEIDALLDSSYLIPFLEKDKKSFFTQVGLTERPDVACSKMNEGRVVIMVDGSPFVLIVPYLFYENFQNADDYFFAPFYALFMRTLRAISFVITITLPAFYVAIGTFHQELFPDWVLYNVTKADATTPFPLLVEAIFTYVVFEIIREAGLRLPKAVGGTVSIVGGLVIGQAAVTAGLVGAPMVIVVALTAIGSFIIPSLYEPMSLLRLIFTIVGGFLGIYGIMIGLGVLGVNICSVNNYGLPYTSPLTPFRAKSWRDVLFRQSWRKLQSNRLLVQDMPGREPIEPEDQQENG